MIVPVKLIYTLNSMLKLQRNVTAVSIYSAADTGNITLN